jgi:hypothetical protein
LRILSADQQLVEAGGALAPGVKVLGEKRESNIAALFIADTGGALHGGHTATGRRVMLPWSKENFDCTKLNANGKTPMRRRATSRRVSGSVVQGHACTVCG